MAHKKQVKDRTKHSVKDATVTPVKKGNGSSLFSRIHSNNTSKLLVYSGTAVVVVGLSLAATFVFGGGEEPAVRYAQAVPTPLINADIVVPDNASGSHKITDYNVDGSESEVVAKVTLSPSPTAAPQITLPFEDSLKYEDTNEAILDIQARFMELQYMDSDEPTNYFGPITREATQLFQRTCGLEITGIIDGATYVKLMSEGAPEYTVFEGAEGEDVLELQKRLYELGYLKAKATGFFGTDTLSAVELFQTKNSLPQTGKIDIPTREKLYDADVVANVWAFGDKSEDILPYQVKLFDLGYLANEPDGICGTATVAAIKRFQERNGLIADGFLGPKTMDVLMSADAIPNSLALGMSGDDVLKVQEKLNKLKYLTDDMLTGYFGAVTDYAVRAFQKENSLTVDGRVGKQTMAVLQSDDAKPAPAGYKQQSNSSTPGGNGGGSGNSNGGSSGGSSAPIPPASDQPSVQNMIDIALSRLGCKYVKGGKGPEKFDCSGLVYWVLNRAGISQPYLTSYSWRSVKHYPKVTRLSETQAGDVLVFYGHVGLAISGSEMVDASSSNGKVVRRSSQSNWCQRNFICAFRVFG